MHSVDQGRGRENQSVDPMSHKRIKQVSQTSHVIAVVLERVFYRLPRHFFRSEVNNRVNVVALDDLAQLFSCRMGRHIDFFKWQPLNA